MECMECLIVVNAPRVERRRAAAGRPGRPLTESARDEGGGQGSSNVSPASPPDARLGRVRRASKQLPRRAPRTMLLTLPTAVSISRASEVALRRYALSLLRPFTAPASAESPEHLRSPSVTFSAYSFAPAAARAGARNISRARFCNTAPGRDTPKAQPEPQAVARRQVALPQGPRVRLSQKPRQPLPGS